MGPAGWPLALDQVPSVPVVLRDCLPAATPPVPTVSRAGIGLAAFAVGSASMVALARPGGDRLGPARWPGLLGPRPAPGDPGPGRGRGGRPPRLIVCRRSLITGRRRADPAVDRPAGRFAEAEPDGWIEAALANEWAHIRNGDLWLLAAARLMLPLLFAHPLYAWLRRRIRDDQEALADAAAAEGRGRIAYAEALLCWSRTAGEQAPPLVVARSRAGGAARRSPAGITPCSSTATSASSPCPRGGAGAPARGC